MLVRFDKIFWRQASAALATVIIHSVLTGSPEESMIILWSYITVLMVQEWLLDLRERRKERGRESAAACGCRKSA